MKILLFYLTALLLLSGCSQGPADEKVPGRWFTQNQVAEGKAVFQTHCAECHGKEAQGLADDWRKTLTDGSYPPPPLNGTAHAWHHPLKMLQRNIQRGGIPLGGKMPSFKDKINDNEQLAAIAFFQNFWNDEIYNVWLERGGLE